MFQKEKILISLEEEYTNINYTLRALNDTFVFLMQQTEEGNRYSR